MMNHAVALGSAQPSQYTVSVLDMDFHLAPLVASFYNSVRCGLDSLDFLLPRDVGYFHALAGGRGDKRLLVAAAPGVAGPILRGMLVAGASRLPSLSQYHTAVPLVDAFRDAAVHGKVGQIGSLAIDENYRGNGVGRKLVQAGEGVLRQMGVTHAFGLVVLDNHDSRELFTRSGYAVVGTSRRDTPGSLGLNRFIMGKAL